MNAIDLTTIDFVAGYLNLGAGVDASILQSLITDYSQSVLTITGRPYLSGIRNYSERYNGLGGQILQVRNYPILAVTSVQVFQTVIPQSPDYIQAGWVIDTSGSQCSIAIVGNDWVGASSVGQWPGTWGGNWGAYGNAPALGSSPYVFAQGIQNVAVSYTAGYTQFQPAETQQVDPSAYTVVVNNNTAFWEDNGVTLSDGTPLTPIESGSPLAGQYIVSGYGTTTPGLYTFNVAQGGAQVNIAYTFGGPPLDLQEAVTEWVGDVYRSRQWIGQKSQVQPGIGTTSYQSWNMPDRVKMTAERYRMRFLI